jgi:hypothetical protein
MPPGTESPTDPTAAITVAASNSSLGTVTGGATCTGVGTCVVAMANGVAGPITFTSGGGPNPTGPTGSTTIHTASAVPGVGETPGAISVITYSATHINAAVNPATVPVGGFDALHGICTPLFGGSFTTVTVSVLDAANQPVPSNNAADPENQARLDTTSPARGNDDHVGPATFSLNTGVPVDEAFASAPAEADAPGGACGETGETAAYSLPGGTNQYGTFNVALADRVAETLRLDLESASGVALTTNVTSPTFTDGSPPVVCPCPLATNRPLFSWSSVPVANSYTIRLFDATGTTLIAQVAGLTSLQFSGDTTHLAGGNYTWDVVTDTGAAAQPKSIFTVDSIAAMSVSTVDPHHPLFAWTFQNDECGTSTAPTPLGTYCDPTLNANGPVDADGGQPNSTEITSYGIELLNGAPLVPHDVNTEGPCGQTTSRSDCRVAAKVVSPDPNCGTIDLDGCLHPSYPGDTSGLVSGHTYYVRVIAINRFGLFGALSDPVNFTAP